MSKEKNVHTEHCCIVHGCKYGEEETCPVWNGLLRQSYPCERCSEENVFPDDYFAHHRKAKNDEYFRKISQIGKEEKSE